MATEGEILKLVADFRTKWQAMTKAWTAFRDAEEAARTARDVHYASQQAATEAKEALQRAILGEPKPGREFI